MIALRRMTGPLALLMLLGITSCDPELGPVAPTDESDPDPGELAPAQTGDGPYAERARFLDGTRLPLISTAEQREVGEYRFQVVAEPEQPYERDDVVVVQVDGKPEPRLVLSATRNGNELILDTGPALWSDVVNSGSYGFIAPIGPGETTTLDGEVLPSFAEEGDVEIPKVGGEFELDLCVLAADILANLPGENPPTLCDTPRSMGVSGLGVSLNLEGTIDSLSLLDSEVWVSGSMSVGMDVDGGGVSGGTPPVFSPCNRKAYPGCLATPTGADFIEWLRSYAPEIPEASLRPVRVCIPGSPIRVKAGYWVYPGFPQIPYWVPPEHEICRIQSTGTLPTVIPPSVRSARAMFQPRVTGSITPYIAGDGKLTLRVPLPYPLAASFDKQLTSYLQAEASYGVFVGLELTAKNAAGSVRTEFDEEVRITMDWDPESGWRSTEESMRSAQGIDPPDLENPDSLVLKVSTPILRLGVEASLISPDTTEDDGWLDGLSLGVDAGAEAAFFYEIIASRRPMHPSDPDLDTWQANVATAYEFTPEASLNLPDFIPDPPVETSWGNHFEWGRVTLADLYGIGGLLIETSTTGQDLPEGTYSVRIVQDPDLAERLLPDNVELGPDPLRDFAVSQGRTIEMDLDERSGISLVGPPCLVAYTDGAPLHLVIIGLRRAGASIPNLAYPYVSTCLVQMVAAHHVEIIGVPDHCTVAGGPVRTDVWPGTRRFGVDAGADTTVVNFDVTCGQRGEVGVLRVLVDLLSDVKGDLIVRLESAGRALMRAGATQDLGDVAAGERTIVLDNVPSYCTAEPLPVDVEAGATTDVTISAICDYPEPDLTGTVTVSTSTTGEEPPGGFPVHLDSEPRGTASASEPAIVGTLTPGMASVLRLGLPGRCRAPGGDLRVVTPDGELTPMDAHFDAECVAAVDTLVGTIGTSAFPVRSVALEDNEGGSVRLLGPARDELFQMAGLPVRVWGVRQGTSLDVYGYSLRSPEGESRFVGVVLDREDDLWLFGERSLKLMDTTGDLPDRVGDLIWVGGIEVGSTSLVPTVYGVLREDLP